MYVKDAAGRRLAAAGLAPSKLWRSCSWPRLVMTSAVLGGLLPRGLEPARLPSMPGLPRRRMLSAPPDTRMPREASLSLACSTVPQTNCNGCGATASNHSSPTRHAIDTMLVFNLLVTRGPHLSSDVLMLREERPTDEAFAAGDMVIGTTGGGGGGGSRTPSPET